MRKTFRTRFLEAYSDNRKSKIQNLKWVGLLVLLVGWAGMAEAQQVGKIARIGFLGNSPTSSPKGTDAFRQGLRDLGWVEGKNIFIEYRWAQGHLDRLPDLAAELVRLKVDVILAPSSIYVDAARRATSTIPIVFAIHADPIASGHVATLARPGGNITGLSQMLTELNSKGLELLKETVPKVSRVAVLWDPATPSNGPVLKAVEAAARGLGVRLQSLAVQGPGEFERAFSAMRQERAGALLVVSAVVFATERQRLADLALKYQLPTMFGSSQFVEAGGLMSYGADLTDLYRRSATYVDKILKGAKPADLPVEQAMKFEFVINLKTAKQVGLTIPPNVLARADRVIK